MTVASESAFSTGERVVSDFRSRLTTDTIEALICLQDWLRAAGWKYVSLVHMVLVYWFTVLCLYPNNIQTLFISHQSVLVASTCVDERSSSSWF